MKETIFLIWVFRIHYLRDDLGVLRRLNRDEHVGDLILLVRVRDRLEQGPVLKELLVLLSLFHARVSHDVIEGLSVESPQLAVSLSLDRGLHAPEKE